MCVRACVQEKYLGDAMKMAEKCELSDEGFTMRTRQVCEAGRWKKFETEAMMAGALQIRAFICLNYTSFKMDTKDPRG